jgi:hypothetical protein
MLFVVQNYFLVFEPQWALRPLKHMITRTLGEIGKVQLFFVFGATWGTKLNRTLKLNVNKSPRDIIRGARKDNV